MIQGTIIPTGTPEGPAALKRYGLKELFTLFLL